MGGAVGIGARDPIPGQRRGKTVLVYLLKMQQLQMVASNTMAVPLRTPLA